MRYREVLSQAYTLTVSNPVLWLFGLVMLGGFNLSLINFYSIFKSAQWKQWSLVLDYLFSSELVGLGVIFFAVTLAFILLNIFKIIFISQVHGIVHKKGQLEISKKCTLCLKSGDSLPYREWIPRVSLASLITVGFSFGISFAANAFINTGGYDGPMVVIINLFFVVLMVVVLGVWNSFTSYFIVLHNLNFERAAIAAIDLMIAKYRQIFEFVVLLSLIHTASVLVTTYFINLPQFWGSAFYAVELIALAWFALNNAFFNIAFIIFFDSLVKSIPKEESVSRLLAQNRLN